MISHKNLTRADIGDVAAYYNDAADDYYAKEGESQVWQGRGAEALGLVGEVDNGRFRELLAGVVKPGEASVRQTVRDDSKNRIGIDLTFSAPKGVSIHALVGGDLTLIQAHDAAVAKALELAETRAQARRKVDGKSYLETTGNLIVAKFRHETTRTLDPALHTHAVVMNLTQRSDGTWRALRNDEIIKNTMILGAVYRSELARILESKGYALRHDRDGMFDLASVSRDQVAAFSQRSAQIEAHLEAKGLTRETASTAQMQTAALQTRSGKEAGVDRDQLYAHWRDRAAELGIAFGPDATARSQAEIGDEFRDPLAEIEAPSAARAVKYAINHLTERNAIITRSSIQHIALNHALGRVSLEAIDEALAQRAVDGKIVAEAATYRPASEALDLGSTRADLIADLVARGQDQAAAEAYVDLAIQEGLLVQNELRYTTPRAIAWEAQILAIEQEGRDQLVPLMTLDEASARLGPEPLNDGQRGSGAMMLTTPNRVVGISGLAGTGKSHMLKIVNAAIAETGHRVIALAPYGTQKKALKELGVTASTVAAFLHAQDRKIDGGSVLVIDEAGVVPARQMAQLLKVAEDANARVVLLGDTAQTKAIEAGRPFDQLLKAGMAASRMDEIQRQKDPTLKEAVVEAARGDTKAALAKLPHIHEIAAADKRWAAIATQYVGLSDLEREKTIIVSGTNDARRAINTHVRDGLGLAGAGREYDMLIRRDTSQEERRFSRNYQIGDTVQPERDYANYGLKKGELYTVVDNGPSNHLTVRDRDGADTRFSPKLVTNLSVYRTERGELAIGDLVRITRNEASKDLANGERFRVTAQAGDNITISDGQRSVVLPTKTALHLDHAYATTVHSSQGLTENRVLVDAPTNTRTTARDTFYVDISRARYEVHLYTNNADRLPRAISRDNHKSAALDLRREDQVKPIRPRPPRETAKVQLGRDDRKNGLQVRRPEVERDR